MFPVVAGVAATTGNITLLIVGVCICGCAVFVLGYAVYKEEVGQQLKKKALVKSNIFST